MKSYKHILNFNQKGLAMKTLLLFSFMFAMMGIQTMAATTAPVPAPTPIRIDPTIRPGAGQMSPGLKKAIADKAAIDKILNATVSKVEFQMSKIPTKTPEKPGYKTGYILGTVSLFGDRKITLKENNNGNFVLIETLSNMPPNKPVIAQLDSYRLINETHSFTPGTTTRYKDLMNNGFTVNIDFTKKIGLQGFEFKCDFLLIFYFTDGTNVAVALQDNLTLSTVGKNVYPNEVHVSKNMPGGWFPDPENPLPLLK